MSRLLVTCGMHPAYSMRSAIVSPECSVLQHQRANHCAHAESARASFNCSLPRLSRKSEPDAHKSANTWGPARGFASDLAIGNAPGAQQRWSSHRRGVLKASHSLSKEIHTHRFAQSAGSVGPLVHKLVGVYALAESLRLLSSEPFFVNSML